MRPKVLVPLLVVVVVVIVAGISLFSGGDPKTYAIATCNMAPTAEPGDRMVASSRDEPRRGDLVVFERPEGAPLPPGRSISRVVGMPGDTIEAIDGVVHIDGEPLDEPYLEPGVETHRVPQTEIPDEGYWVMGDNRSNSADSRVFGTVTRSSIESWGTEIERGDRTGEC